MKIAYNVPLKTKNFDGSVVIKNEIIKILKKYNLSNYISFYDDSHVDGSEVLIFSKDNSKITIFSFKCNFLNIFVNSYKLYYLRPEQLKSVCISCTHEQIVNNCKEVSLLFDNLDGIHLKGILDDFDIDENKIMDYIEHLI